MLDRSEPSRYPHHHNDGAHGSEDVCNGGDGRDGAEEEPERRRGQTDHVEREEEDEEVVGAVPEP